jgi:hypothetical protein
VRDRKREGEKERKRERETERERERVTGIRKSLKKNLLFVERVYRLTF